MKSFLRMFLSMFALAIVLFALVLMFSPQVRTAFTSQSGERAIGQLKSDSQTQSPGQAQKAPAAPISPEESSRASETQSGATSSSESGN